MRTQESAVAIIVACALSGWSPAGLAKDPPADASRAQCNGQNCTVSVTANNCAVQVAPQVLELRGGKTPRKIKWKIDTAGYKFSTDSANYGIFIKGSGAGQFHTPTADGTSITLNYRQSTIGNTFEYGVNLIDRNGTKCATLDPWIVD